MHATKNARSKFAPPRPVEAHDAQLVEIAIELLHDLLRVGNELALYFIHHAISLAQIQDRPRRFFSARRLEGCVRNPIMMERRQALADARASDTSVFSKPTSVASNQS